MAFTVTFPTAGPLADATEVAAWLTEQGEPFDQEGPTLSLRALPLRIVVAADSSMHAWIDVATDTPLVRLVDLLFALSVKAGADVRLAGQGEMTRPRLWMRLADEQDRLRIALALDQAEMRGIATEVAGRLWAMLAALKPGQDLRWDAAGRRIVEMVEVGPGGISMDEASWLKEGASAGDVVPKPADGPLHILAWRFLSEAWPGLIEDR